MTGRVVHGRGEGGVIAVPTANIVPSAIAAVPANGVYAGEVYIGTEPAPAAISVGPPPSFETSGRHMLEAHVIGFEGDLYHTELTLGFTHHLRDLEHFGDPEALRARIEGDIRRVKELAAS
jgi:FAD synthase